MKTLTITLTLPVSEENEGVINLIALYNGWQPETGETNIEASEKLAQRDIGTWLENKIYSAYTTHYGESRAEDRANLIQQYKDNTNISLTFE